MKDAAVTFDAVSTAWESKNLLYFNLVVNDPFLCHMVHEHGSDEVRKKLEDMKRVLAMESIK